MTLIEILIAILITGLFLIGFSQAVLPLYNNWNMIISENKTINSVLFIVNSFKNECLKPDYNMETWKNAIAHVIDPQNCKIIELKQNEIVRALKAVCIINGYSFEVIGAVNP